MAEALVLVLLFVVIMGVLAKLAVLLEAVVASLTDPRQPPAETGARYTSRGRVLRTVRRRSLRYWRRMCTWF